MVILLLYRLGQACNHIAALLFFIDYHANDIKLPVELSKTPIPMKWNQPPKKAVNPACASDMNFVKPSHGDLPEQSKSTGCSTFDPRRTEDRELQKEMLQQLMALLEKTVPNTGLAVWPSRKPVPCRNFVAACHFFTPACIYSSTRQVFCSRTCTV